MFVIKTLRTSDTSRRCAQALVVTACTSGVSIAGCTCISVTPGWRWRKAVSTRSREPARESRNSDSCQSRRALNSCCT